MKRARADEPLDLAVAFRFLRALARSNDRSWFHAHRDPWDSHIRHGFEDLVTMLLLAGSDADARLRNVDPRACLFRLANDTRFRHDKTPYKTWLSAWLSPGGKNGACAGYYVHLAPGASHVSAGIYVPERPVLRALRAVFAENASEARSFDRLLDAPPLRPFLPLQTDPLRLTPPGFARTHPRIALIRARRFLLQRGLTDAELRERGTFAVFRAAMRDTAPFVRWLDAHGAATQGAGEPDEEW